MTLKNIRNRASAIGSLINSDLYRYYGNTRCKTLIGAYFLNRSFNYCLWLRLAKSGIPLISWFAKKVHSWKSRAYSIHIPVEVEIGVGLYIAHGMPLVINPTAKIGNNCNLSQFVTIGSNHGRAARIGDNVYIGPGVSIVEGVEIGSDVIVGAGAVVVHSISPGTTVVGVPARSIGPNRHPEYIGNRWPLTVPTSTTGLAQ